jgi:hypothetical protein
MRGDRLVARLGSDLAGLVEDVGVPLSRAVRITRLPSSVLTRAAFRLEFGDGAMLKGRRLESAADAERMAALAACVDLPALPRVLSRRGTAVLEEWVSGVPLGRYRLAPEDLTRSGALLGAIHGAVVPEASWTPTPPTPTERLARADRRLLDLARLGLLAPAVVDRLRRLVDTHVPARQAVGIIHRDFCFENLVRGSTGALHVVDNEALTLDAYDLDLARTWYRWPMSAAQRQAFEAGYARHRGLETYRAHFPFWAVVVLAEAALFRRHAKARGQGIPLRRLVALLAALDRGPRP